MEKQTAGARWRPPGVARIHAERADSCRSDGFSQSRGFPFWTRTCSARHTVSWAEDSMLNEPSAQGWRTLEYETKPGDSEVTTTTGGWPGALGGKAAKAGAAGGAAGDVGGGGAGP